MSSVRSMRRWWAIAPEPASGRTAHFRYDPAMRQRPPTVVALVFEPVASFELGVACEVFGLDRSEMGVPRFRFLVCSDKTGIVQTKDHGVDVVIRHGLEALRAADI